MRYVEEWDNNILLKLRAILDPVDDQGTFYPKVGIAIAQELLPVAIAQELIIYEKELLHREDDVEQTKATFLEKACELQERLSNLISEYNRVAKFQKISEKLAKQT
jgi:hypothetical protein